MQDIVPTEVERALAAELRRHEVPGEGPEMVLDHFYDPNPAPEVAGATIRELRPAAIASLMAADQRMAHSHR